MKAKILILFVIIAVVAVAAAWLFFGWPQDMVDTTTYSANAVSHTIGPMTITPSSIVAGSSTPVTITAQIPDPTVIRNGVTLVYLSASGSPRVIGHLHDNGVDGDLIANDNVFTLATTTLFAEYPTGTLHFRISAAYLRTSRQTQSGVFELKIVPPVPTSNWTVLTDVQKLFSISVPADWNSHLDERQTSGEAESYDVDVDLSDGTLIFSIGVYTHQAWTAMQSEDGPVPIFIGQNSSFVFGYSGRQDGIIGEPISQETIDQALPQILATFKPTE